MAGEVKVLQLKRGSIVVIRGILMSNAHQRIARAEFAKACGHDRFALVVLDQEEADLEVLGTVEELIARVQKEIAP